MKIIEFTGTSKSGKSALIKKLDFYLKEKGMVSEIINEGFRSCSFKDRKDCVFDQQLWTVFTLGNRILKVVNSDIKLDYLFLDRGFWDRLVYIEFYRIKKVIRNHDYNFLLIILKRFLPSIDQVFFLILKPEISRERNLLRGKVSLFNIEEIAILNDLYSRYLPSNSVILDGENKLDDLFWDILGKI